MLQTVERIYGFAVKVFKAKNELQFLLGRESGHCVMDMTVRPEHLGSVRRHVNNLNRKKI